MKLLLHICCAPCSVACVQSLRAEGIEPTGYWYNPNIHPFTEYRQRRNTLVEYAKSIGMALEMDDEYGLRPFTRAVGEHVGARCLVCYAARMRQTARYTAEHGFTHFTSTLFISPYQKHALMRAAAEDAAAEYGITFLYRDFRPLYRQGQQEARELGLYIQKYCGCVYSEEERYVKRLSKMAMKTAHREKAALDEPGAVPPAVPQQTHDALQLAGQRYEAAKAAEEQRLCGVEAELQGGGGE